MTAIRVQNYFHQPYRGWVMTTIPQAEAERLPKWGLAPGATVVVGRPLAVDRTGRPLTVALHLFVDLNANQGTQVDLERVEPTLPNTPSIPVEAAMDPVGFFGVPQALGYNSQIVSVIEDGPGALILSRVRAGSVTVDIWTQWYPGQAHAITEALFVNSDIEKQCPEVTITPTVSSPRAYVFMPGIGQETTFGVDQAQGFHGFTFWPRDANQSDLQSAQASIWVHAIYDGWEKHWGPFHGISEISPRFDALPWMRGCISRLEPKLGSWSHSEYGPAASSGVTGGQEDQGWGKCSEAFDTNGNGAQYARYLVALQMARRPNNWRYSNGRSLAPGERENLVLWSGRPHWHTGVSPDQLGQNPAPTRWQGGYFGPDREHWLVNSLCGAYLLTGSPILQRIIKDQITVYMYGETVDPRLSTSHSGAPRGVGWTNLAAAWLAISCDDPWLVSGLRARALARLAIQKAECGNSYQVGRFATTTDQRVMQYIPNAPRAWVPWQHSIAAMGCAAAFEVFQDPAFLDLALQAARATVNYAWVQRDEQWIGLEAVGELEDGVPLPESAYAPDAGYVHGHGSFNAWNAAAAAVILRYQQMVNDAEACRKADKIYAQELARQMANGSIADWLVPI